MRKLRPREMKRMSPGWKHHLWTLWHYPDIVCICNSRARRMWWNIYLLFSWSLLSDYTTQSRSNSSSIPILAPCLFTISFLLSTRSPQSFLAPCFPLGSHLYLGWAIKDLSSPIHLWRKLWVLQILQNKTVPNKLFSADWFSNLKA